MSRFESNCPECGKSFKNSHVEMRTFCSVGCQADSIQAQAEAARGDGQLSKERSPEHVAHEEEIQRLKDAGEVLIRSLERMTKERDEAHDLLRAVAAACRGLGPRTDAVLAVVGNALAERDEALAVGSVQDVGGGKRNG